MNPNLISSLILIVSIKFLHIKALDSEIALSDTDLNIIQLKLWLNLNKNIELIINNINKQFSELNKKLDATEKNLKIIENKFESLEIQTNTKFDKLENVLKLQSVENQNLIEKLELKISDKLDRSQKVTNEYEHFEKQTTKMLQNIENQIKSEYNKIENKTEFHSKLSQNSFKELKSLLDTIQKDIEIGIPTDCSWPNINYCQNSKCYIQNKIYGPQPFWVGCDQQTDKGGWIVIQRRINGAVNFDRNWQEYKEGFGDIDGEFWLGLDKMHALTSTQNMELKIILRDFNDTDKFANYNSFKIGNETEKYALKVIGGYTGNAGNALAYHLGLKFTTKDQDNDMDTEINCADNHWGGWWYHKCAYCKLNGKYYHNVQDEELKSKKSGVHWSGFQEANYSLKYVQMMIRPRKNE